jgi:hypothetical protein
MRSAIRSTDGIQRHQRARVLGKGRPYFQDLPAHVQLSLIEAVPAPGVMHLRYRVER